MGVRADPFGFQLNFATSADLPSLVRIPTGLGKTAMAVLGWIWRRREAPEALRASTPRRLAYCLPMRTLVEQTAEAARSWIQALGLEADIDVHVLMGGEDEPDWDRRPEREAILIGTQDMLLSRALNRGYAMSRYRWPLPFALLHNDCLWILDEVQLMDVGVATSAQLEGFRKAMETIGATQSIWMSATLDPSWLETVDFPAERLASRLELSDDDLANDYVQKLWNAPKQLTRSEAAMGDARACADAVVEAHKAGSKTLAIFNTVKRAREVHDRLRKQKGLPPVALIHSRFRQPDRDRHLNALLNEPEVIAVSTQVVEAGVDVSATTLLTELAPWASLVQRFGRCNRRGNDENARAIWFDPGDLVEKSKDAAPYEVEDLNEARARLATLDDVSLASLERVEAAMPLRADHVLRRRDLVDLFDTTPDLAGNDIDVSRFIRSGDEHDVKVFWRAFEGDPEEQPAPRRDELCSAPVFALREFRNDTAKDKRTTRALWRWDGLDEKWVQVEERDIYAGQTYLIRASAGGYTAEAGWDPKSKDDVAPRAPAADAPDFHSRDYEAGPWLSIAEHTDDVVRTLDEILATTDLPDDLARELREAARWHDWGKAHEQFQQAFPERPDEWRDRDDVAKGRWTPYKRKGFRHELASALGMLACGKSDLSVYLAAAHHGKVRLSIRSMPHEKRPPGPEKLYARGVWDGDVLPETSLGGGVTAPETPLSLEPMRMGRSEEGAMSWAERTLRLREKYGPFQLAYLEALLRAADMRASEAEARRAPEECP
jgi:CRISPR-associated endonuclease/helicase Cas3